ncbi:unnamed protein product [Schistosoma curassoni]|uniref:Uncharacterized protein n=1 Tax=Schistosoma curassoni TaxID=6186 RepID=A0A183K7G1_9TREM|nr:unnamed protein product [Schistosoma curassoni]
MTDDCFIRHLFPQDTGSHVHHWFGIRVFRFPYVNSPYPPTRLKRRTFAFCPLNSVNNTVAT